MTILAEVQADHGSFAEAETLFRRAIALDPDSPEAWAGIAQSRNMHRGDAPWLTEAQRVAGNRLAPRQETRLRYAIGKYFDDVREFDQAFSNYQRANELTRRQRIQHDRQRLTRAVDRLIRVYDREWLEKARVEGDPSVRPVFIVGTPRSGTSLAEQILASHPDVFGAGELMYWNDAAAAHLSAAQHGASPREFGRRYLQLLERSSAHARRVIDKMPTNFTFLGLIHAALPNARIIHMRRNPIDSCLSIYFQDFNALLSCATDLGDLAHYYTEYRRLMHHWQAVLPGMAILDVPYEGLVADQEGCSRRMLEFVGLPWDPRCLEFHQTSRTVLTPSKWQVRQKIDSASVERWRNYEKHIGPLRHLLDQPSADNVQQ